MKMAETTSMDGTVQTPGKARPVKAGPLKTLILGLGHPVLGDDAAGWKVIEAVQHQLPTDSSVDVACLSVGGIRLMEHLIGYERAILVDALNLEGPTGSILVLELSELPNYSASRTKSARGMTLQNAILWGQSLGAQLPEAITIVGITTQQIHDFSGGLSFAVMRAVPKAAQIILDLLTRDINARPKR